MSVELHRVQWLPHIVDKIESKHAVATDEVEEMLFDDAPQFRQGAMAPGYHTARH